MKEFLKYLGSILILVGVAILAIYYFGDHSSNLFLAAAGIIMVIGCVTHIVLNRNIE